MPARERDGRGGLSEADRQKRRQALEGPCKDLQQGAFGHRSEEERQEFQDAFQRFAQCMRQNGVDVPDPTAGGGSGGGVRMHELDRDDPDVQAAQEKCQSELPQRGGRRGVGAQ